MKSDKQKRSQRSARILTCGEFYLQNQIEIEFVRICHATSTERSGWGGWQKPKTNSFFQNEPSVYMLCVQIRAKLECLLIQTDQGSGHLLVSLLLVLVLCLSFDCITAQREVFNSRLCYTNLFQFRKTLLQNNMKVFNSSISSNVEQRDLLQMIVFYIFEIIQLQLESEKQSMMNLRSRAQLQYWDT